MRMALSSSEKRAPWMLSEGTRTPGALNALGIHSRRAEALPDTFLELVHLGIAPIASGRRT